MLLQELFKEENKELKVAYSITLDENSSATDYSSPPENLEEIGFVFKVDEDGMMSEDLMDLVISYRLTNLPVLIEVPTQMIIEGKVEAKYLVQLSSNVDFSIALLPPGHTLVKESITVSQYKEAVMKVLEEMLNKPNFDKFIYPISNFFEYLMLEQILGKEKLANFRPENKYVMDNFSSIMTHQDSDDFKVAIRGRLHDFYGGEEEFKLVAQTILDGVYEKSQEIFKDIVAQTVPEYVGTNGVLPDENAK